MLNRLAQAGLGAVCGGAAAGFSAATMAIGAKVFEAGGYQGYDVGQAAAAGAVGSAVLAGGIGLVAGLVRPGDPGSGKLSISLKVSGDAVAGLLCNAAVGSVVGAAILQHAGHQNMAVDSLFAASVCGGLVLTAAFAAVIVPVVLCAVGASVCADMGFEDGLR